MTSMKAQSRVALVALAALSLTGAAVGAEPGLTANTKAGRVEGMVKGGSVAFLGIPYAAPPVGDARWKPPTPAAKWDGVRKTVAFSASCPQTINPPEGRAPWTPEYLIPGATSEDCLYLNVWKPLKASKTPAPILVFFHGGGFVEGSGSVPVYDGAGLAAKGIIVVTINYRLGILGFMNHPELAAEQGGQSGNYGLEDIIASLRWVKANAAAFGGDPARVTISGQSAGSGGVVDMIASPQAKGLFSRAITESGAGWNPGMTSMQASQAAGEAFAKRIGAGSIAALRAMPADALVKAAVDKGGRFSAVVDGKVLPMDPSIALTAGKFNDTPMLSGANADEASGFESDYGNLKVASLNRYRDQKFWPMQAEAAKFWSASSDAEASQVGKMMSRDRSRGYAYEWAKRRAPKSRYPIYIYQFNHPQPGPTSARYGAFHTSEVPYVFRNLDAPRPWTDADRKISDDMSARWVNFISGRAPDAAGQPKWPAYRTADPKIMMLGDEDKAEELLTVDKRKLFDAVVDGGGKISRY